MKNATFEAAFPNKIYDFISSLAVEMTISFKRHIFVYAIPVLSFAVAIVVGEKTGNHTDFGALGNFGRYILLAIVGGCLLFSAYKLAWLAAVERNPSPTRAFLNSLKWLLSGFLLQPQRLANTLHGLCAFTLVATAFSVLKGAIAILHPFSWDVALSNIDRALHFGQLPHEWLGWLTSSPTAIFAVNIAYNFWFIALLGSMLIAASTEKDSVLRHRYFISSFAVWFSAGFLLATEFSSAGPCYYARLGLGEIYQPLMDKLANANDIYPIWALSTQDKLWDGYIGVTDGSLGISAFPSMHVAIAVLIALYAHSRSPAVGIAMWMFAGIILVGSVALGWHYAVDGYGGALLSILIWKAAGWFCGRFPSAQLARESDISPC
jgi:hypothetical protein